MMSEIRIVTKIPRQPNETIYQFDGQQTALLFSEVKKNKNY